MASKFQKGQSGNPAGRPRGSGEAAAWRAAIGKDVAKVIAVVTKLALGGDVAAARLLLDRAVPVLKSIDTCAKLPMPADGTATEKAVAVIQAISAGTIPVSQGSQLIGAIAALQGIVSTDDVVRRIEAIEARLANAKP